jgi:hypothetical protein
MSQLVPDPKASETLVQDLRQLISDARRHAASVVNSALTLLYWRVGDRIRRDVLQNERARYGEQILATLSQELIAEFGRGFDATNLSRMMKFVESFPDEEIVATLSQQLSWSHFRELLPLDQPLQREFYAEMCRMEGWSVRTLRCRYSLTCRNAGWATRNIPLPVEKSYSLSCRNIALPVEIHGLVSVP